VISALCHHVVVVPTEDGLLIEHCERAEFERALVGGTLFYTVTHLREELGVPASRTVRSDSTTSRVVVTSAELSGEQLMVVRREYRFP
jgi:hypothetical protein